MFGYVVADQANLSEGERGRYQQVYCGLCRTIGKRWGQSARMVLTYDMAFLVLLLESLYEPERQQGEGRCLPHPVHPRRWSSSRAAEYAADMNVALAYYNCLDDWQDDKKLSRLAVAKSLEHAYEQVKEQWPRQCKAIETCIDRLSRLERQGSGDLDGVSRCFGVLMGELLVWKEDFWAENLRECGLFLGQFIYLMDAFLDREEDDRKGRYNPISVFERENGSFDGVQTLTMLIGDSTLAFERLPLEQDLSLLRNILYSGVWVRYGLWMEKRTRGRRKEEQST